jgi:hypothetical protein
MIINELQEGGISLLPERLCVIHHEFDRWQTWGIDCEVVIHLITLGMYIQLVKSAES